MLTEENIPFLKNTLYDMDELSKDENIEAKEKLSSIIKSSKISIVERLILMIQIKAQIVGRKKRRFYIEKELFLSARHGNVSHPEVFAQLINGELKITGGINDTFKPYYGSLDDDEIVRNYSQVRVISDSGTPHLGHWEISKNFKELRFNYSSDKRWKNEVTYYGVVV